MPTVNADPGSPTANSYVTVVEANDYFGSAFGRHLWIQTNVDDQGMALIAATQTLDNYFTWNGESASSTQALGYPRSNVYTETGALISNTVVPTGIKRATMELAYHMLSTGANLSFEEQVVESVKVGSVAVKFSDTSVDSGIPDFIERMLLLYGESVLPRKGQVRMARLVRT